MDRTAYAVEREIKRTVVKGVGLRIRDRRIELGLSQRQIAFPGCSYAYISRVERGDRSPSLTCLIGLAHRLDVSALYLLTGHDDSACPLCGREAAQGAGAGRSPQEDPADRTPAQSSRTGRRLTTGPR